MKASIEFLESAFTEAEKRNFSIKEAYPHRITRVNGYPELRPVAQRIHKLGLAWYTHTGFNILYYPN